MEWIRRLYSWMIGKLTRKTSGGGLTEWVDPSLTTGSGEVNTTYWYHVDHRKGLRYE